MLEKKSLYSFLSPIHLSFPPSLVLPHILSLSCLEMCFRIAEASLNYPIQKTTLRYRISLRSLPRCWNDRRRCNTSLHVQIQFFPLINDTLEFYRCLLPLLSTMVKFGLSGNSGTASKKNLCPLGGSSLSMTLIV